MAKRARSQEIPGAPQEHPDLVAWAQAVNAAQLTEQTAKEAQDYLSQYRHLGWAARREVGLRLAAVVASQVSPPPPATIAPLDILATAVAAWRRQLGIG
jgi:hypothetical protein